MKICRCGSTPGVPRAQLLLCGGSDKLEIGAVGQVLEEKGSTCFEVCLESDKSRH